MSIKEIVLYPDDPLTKKAEPFESIGPDVAELAAEMFETMYVKDGVGRRPDEDVSALNRVSSIAKGVRKRDAGFKPPLTNRAA